MNKSNIVRKARDFALKVHGDQKYGSKPYIYHLDAVVEILTQYNSDIQAIGYLHDVIEDTATTKEDIQKEFDDFIAECVSLVTDEPGRSRKTRKLATNAKLKAIDSLYQQALIVKAADRLANLNACISDGQKSLLRMYMIESQAFKDSVYRRGLCDDIWQRIDSISRTRNNQKPSNQLGLF